MDTQSATHVKAVIRGETRLVVVLGAAQQHLQMVRFCYLVSQQSSLTYTLFLQEKQNFSLVPLQFKYLFLSLMVYVLKDGCRKFGFLLLSSITLN